MRGFTCVLACLGAFGALAGGASAKTITVDARLGNDANRGRASKPVKTITRGVRLARKGDKVMVRSGVYREMVQVTRAANGATIRNAPGARPIVDGGGKLPYGFAVRGTTRVRLRGFEVRAQRVSGVQVKLGRSNVVKDMNIHDVGELGQNASQGVEITRGSYNKVIGNEIHSIGPGFESRGIWMLQTRKGLVKGNVVYLVRKDGIRDWQSLDDKIVSNQFFLNYNGISFNQTTGAYGANNYVAHNQVGFVAKHVSYQRGLTYWKLKRGHLSKFWHNTIEDSSETGLWIGNSEEPLNHLTVASNIIKGGGYVFIRDVPRLRGPDVKVDGNLYLRNGNRPSAIYKAEHGNEPPPLTSWAKYRKKLGWDKHGWFGSVKSKRLPRVGARRNDAYKRQLGARSTPSASVTWNPLSMKPVDSSSKGTAATKNNLDTVTDNNPDTYWVTETSANEFVTFDFGARRTFNTLVATVFRHFDERNVHGYKFEISDDRKSWVTVEEGVNPDMAGSSLKYSLDQPVSARYLRYTMKDTSCVNYEPRTKCGTQFVLADLQAGLLRSKQRRAWTTSPGPPY